MDSARDDEHRLIARYAAKLAQEARTGMVRLLLYIVYPDQCIGNNFSMLLHLWLYFFQKEKEITHSLIAFNNVIYFIGKKGFPLR